MLSYRVYNDKSECSGCMGCSFVCPNGAISYAEDGEGFFYPEINADLCIGCGKCARMCAFQSGVEKNTQLSHFAIKHKDTKIRKNSRSGGAFVAISDFILDCGGVVYGAVQKTPDSVVHTRATTKEGRNLMCGSKYVQSDMSGVYELIREDLNSGLAVLFCGTPCQAAQIRKAFSEKNFDKLYICDFLCHGVPSRKVWKDNLDFWKRKFKSEIISADFRDKDRFAWETHYEAYRIGKRTVWSRRYTNMFCSNYTLRPSCYSCKYTTSDRVSDFTLADYWGIDSAVPGFNDHKGVSLLIINSEKASELFEKIKDSVEAVDTTSQILLHYNLSRSSRAPQDREAFWNDYSKLGFEYVSAKYGGYSLLRRIKNKIINKVD